MLSEDLRALARTLHDHLRADTVTLGVVAQAVNVLATASHDARALENAAVAEIARSAGTDLPANVVRIDFARALKNVARPGEGSAT